MRKLAIVLLAVLFVVALGGGYSAAFADDINENFATSYVLDDLAGANIDGKVFNVQDYPQDVKGELRLIAFMEYAYSEKEDLRDYYGLYFYLYNPRAIQFTDDERNKVQIATEYEQQGNELIPTKWEKFNLKLCSISAERLFVKFRVDNVAAIYERVSQHPELRRYDISGLELVTPSSTNAKEYGVGGTWQYSGYARGCGDDVLENTLQCNASTTQVLQLDDLHHTYYRNWIEEYKNGFNSDGIIAGRKAQQLNSVYFSVPNYYVEQYKRLYSIQAETYRYLTSPIVVITDKYITSNQADSYYNRLLSQRNLYDPSKRDNAMSATLYWDYGSGLVHSSNVGRTAYNYFDREYSDTLHTLAWVFRQDKRADEVSVESADLLRYMSEYSDLFDDHSIRGKYASDLFADHYYSYGMNYSSFSNGYYPIDLDVSGDKDFVFTESDSTQSAWDRFFNGQNHVDGKPFSPIVEVSYNDVKGLTDDELAQKYYIAKEDATDFYNYVWSNSDRTVYLFHFAQSDYYSNDVRAYAKFSVYENNNVGFVAQEVAYLDFDIISMGYENDMGHIEIIPVVSNPVDIVSSIESGSPVTGWDKVLDELEDFWNRVENFFNRVGNFATENWWLFVILGVLILFGVLSYFFPVLRVVFKWLWIGLKWLLKILWWIVSAPARLIVLIANSIKNRAERRSGTKT